MIPQSVIDDIKMRNNIEDVISSYVALKRSGNSRAVGLCPFHSEKTPSFSVSLSEEFFYCFGCGAGGDVITFIMRIENLEYPEALEFLAHRAGITISEDTRGSPNTGSGAAVKRERILALNLEAAKYFRDNLFSPVGANALDYLARRGLSVPLIKRFGLGYCDWSSTEYLNSKGFTETELKVGFISAISQTSNKPYDYFHGRVIFPILDVNGHVIAFGGRIMGDGGPKYLNTSDTPAFKKSRNLFALNYAKEYCRDRLILCEGYMDVIALHGAGYNYAVATLGTAITPEQARIMAKMTNEVLICYDSDEAGQRAAEKAFRLLAETGVTTRIIKVEGAKDPDEYIKNFGAAAFEKILASGRSEFEFRFDNILAKYNLNILDEKAKSAEETVNLIASLRSETERELYGRRAAERLSIPYEAIRADAARVRKKDDRFEFQREVENAKRASEGYGDKINPDFVKNPAAGKAEEILIGAFLSRRDLLLGSLAPPTLFTADDCFTEFGRRVISAIIRHGRERPVDLGIFAAEFSLEEMGRITSVKVNGSNIVYDGESVKQAINFLRTTGRRSAALSTEEIIARKRKNLPPKE